MNDRLKIGASDGAQFAVQENGWMNGVIFLKWLEEFIKRTHPTKENPVLLIVDGHCSHKELNVILLAREKNVHMISLPPHCTHRLQPLDRTIMKPFKDSYNEACSLWMRRNPFARITDFEIASLVNIAFTKICRMDLATSGFECTGIHPFNPQIFTDLDYLGSEGLDISDNVYKENTTVDMMNTDVYSEKNIDTDPGPGTLTPQLRSSQGAQAVNHVQAIAEAQPGTSKEFDTTPPSLQTPQPGTSKELHTTPPTSREPVQVQPQTFQKLLEDISPLPIAFERRLNTRKRRGAKSEVLTSTPFKNELEEKMEMKKKKNDKGKRKVQFDENSSQKSNSGKKQKKKLKHSTLISTD